MQKNSILSEMIYFLKTYDNKYVLKNFYKLLNFKIYIFGIIILTGIFFIISLTSPKIQSDKITILYLFLFAICLYTIANVFLLFNSNNSKVELYFLDNKNNTNEDKEHILDFLYETRLLYKLDKSILNKDNTISAANLIVFLEENYQDIIFKEYSKKLEQKEFKEISAGEKCLYFVTSFYLPFCKYEKEIYNYFFHGDGEIKTNYRAFGLVLSQAMNGNKIIAYLREENKEFLTEMIKKCYKEDYQKIYIDFVENL
jgi:hypothetical protein